jgi:hypothetical protein
MVPLSRRAKTSSLLITGTWPVTSRTARLPWSNRVIPWVHAPHPPDQPARHRYNTTLNLEITASALTAAENIIRYSEDDGEPSSFTELEQAWVLSAPFSFAFSGGRSSSTTELQTWRTSGRPCRSCACSIGHRFGIFSIGKTQTDSSLDYGEPL